jgi:hypothetical protein
MMQAVLHVLLLISATFLGFGCSTAQNEYPRYLSEFQIESYNTRGNHRIAMAGFIDGNSNFALYRNRIDLERGIHERCISGRFILEAREERSRIPPGSRVLTFGYLSPADDLGSGDSFSYPAISNHCLQDHVLLVDRIEIIMR